ncbi:alpha/beta fold hydrolase [Spirosoma sp. KUDC1026]|uniref:alpha/beta fold hydrolase n=1 Tax=Spirosoma sp. KUDC1026 TaxID=2745947 RepID=UPI00159BD120|nr:alpha/beta hydrolase [Spirosoma sp. KUDC1026]QKZ15357.1 alpha/beta hydrolase [Spirosoma sp. KUDC1026]
MSFFRKILLVMASVLGSLPGHAQANRDPLFVSFDKTKIHYDVVGEGQPVVLLHGFLNTGETWKRSPLRQALVDAGFKVVTLDLRGNGLSDKPHSAEAYQDNAELKDVTALMKHLGLTQYDVVGYSRGAILTARMLTLDKRIRRAVMGGVNADFTDPNWPRRKAFQEVFTDSSTHPEFKGAVRYAQKIGADLTAMARLQEFQPSTPLTALARVRVPVLVVNGKEDADNPKPEVLVNAIPGAKLVIVPGDHGGAMHRPEFAKAVVEFLTSKR